MRWNDFPRYRPVPKKPPPEHGIRMKKAGTTWWGQRWIEALEHVLLGDSKRLARGRTYARAGRTHDLVVKGRQVTAQVTGSRPTPYEISIELGPLAEAVWRKAIAGMVAKAQFSAELLAGQMPEAIDEVFHEAGVSLFPRQRAELRTSCSCPDWGDPCKHVAAAHYVLGEALDRDPFLLFELRGRSKEQVLDALRAARGAGRERSRGRSTASGTSDTRAHAPDVPVVKLGKLKPADYDRPRETLPSLRFTFDEPAAHGAVLRQLGAPAAWESDESPAEVLEPLVRAAANTARRLATAESSEEGDVEDPPSAGEPTVTARSRAPARKKASRVRRR